MKKRGTFLEGNTYYISRLRVIKSLGYEPEWLKYVNGRKVQLVRKDAAFVISKYALNSGYFIIIPQWCKIRRLK